MTTKSILKNSSLVTGLVLAYVTIFVIEVSKHGL